MCLCVCVGEKEGNGNWGRDSPSRCAGGAGARSLLDGALRHCCVYYRGEYWVGGGSGGGDVGMAVLSGMGSLDGVQADCTVLEYCCLQS